MFLYVILVVLLMLGNVACDPHPSNHQTDQTMTMDQGAEAPVTASLETIQNGNYEWPEVGASLTVPSGWSVALDTGKLGLALNNDSRQDTAVLLFPQIRPVQALAAEMGAPMNIGGFQLVPQEIPEVSGVRISNRYQTLSQNNDVLDSFVLHQQGSFGVGLTILGLTSAQEDIKAKVLEIADSLSFQHPSISPYQEKLTGRLWRRQANQPSYSEYDELKVCANGSFSRVFALNSTGSGSYTSQTEGVWKILAAKIFLHDESRQEETYIDLETSDYRDVGPAGC